MGNQVTKRRPLVFVIDDDGAIRDSLKFSLEIDGFWVRTYASAKELCAVSDLSHCSCLVVDQKLPETCGIDLIAALRRQGLLTPAILITSQPTAALRERASRTGIPIVEKPLIGTALLDGIRRALSQPQP